MGCGYDFCCNTCKKSYYLGYGSYSTWCCVNTLEEFQLWHPRPPLRKNENIKTCLVEHQGHDFEYLLWDICWAKGGDLWADIGPYGESKLYIPDWDQYEKIDLAKDET